MTTNLKNIKAPTSNHKQSSSKVEFSNWLKKISNFFFNFFLCNVKRLHGKSQLTFSFLGMMVD